MTVGETLTEARTQAGLSVDELSERTRIRGTVIRSIEQDDFEACGGDLYARGYVRALAGAVGIDAQPLIREYDQEKAGQHERANGTTGGHVAGVPSAPPPAAALTAFDLPAVPDPPVSERPAGLDRTRFDLPAVSANPAVTAYDLPAVPETPPTAELPVTPPVPPTAELPVTPPDIVHPKSVRLPSAAESPLVPPSTDYDVSPGEPAGADSATAIIPAVGDPAAPGEPAAPSEPAGRATAALPTTVPPTTGQPAAVQHDWVQPDWATPDTPGDGPPGRVRGSRRGLFAVAAIIVVIAIGVVGVRLATGGSTTAKNAAATTVPSSAAPSAASASAAARASASAQAKASASARASESAQARKDAAAKAAAQHVTTLSVASVAAYGPSGLGDGDNPGNVGDAIARHASTPWTSQWYVSPDFGMLKHGTGLLLDLGGKVTVSSVRLELPQFQGTSLQIRVGNGTTSQDLRVAAKATNAAGLVKLTLSQPTAARYLLIWITQLPPDGAGHYQASVANVVVTGRR